MELVIGLCVLAATMLFILWAINNAVKQAKKS